MRELLSGFFTAMLCVSGLVLNAQSSYFSLFCGYPATYEVGSAFSTHISPGTLSFGYNTVVNVNGTWNDNKNICVMGTGTSGMMATYKTYVSYDCNSAPSQIIQQNGLSAVETNGTGGIRYALAGVHDNGIYYIGLNATGNVVGQRSYPFSLEKSANYKRPGKPVIIEGENTGLYYICGAYDNDVYVLKIDAQGNLLWSSYYTLFSSSEPRDMMIDPYHPGSLLVIGNTKVEKKDHEAFILRLSLGSGMVQSCNMYGREIGYDSFNTITVSHDQSNNAPDGFVIGGYQHPLGPNAPSAWILKLDQNLNIQWSNGIYTSIGVNKGYVDLVERLNTSGQYEFYGLLQSNAGMQVTKLNNQGTPFMPLLNQNLNGLNTVKNEFIYEIPALTPSKANSLSYVNSFNTGGPDVGLVVFGNSYFTPGFAGTYQVNAYFNGESNCYRTLSTLPPHKEAPFDKDIVPVLMHDVFTDCHNFVVQAFFISSPLTIFCGGNSANGSNLRPMRGEASEEISSGNEQSFRVFPNPSTSSIQIHFNEPANAGSTIELFDLVGRLVYSVQTSPGLYDLQREESLDFEQLGLPEGLYLLRLSMNDHVRQQKVLYRK